jgi:hypothetical protein
VRIALACTGRPVSHRSPDAAAPVCIGLLATASSTDMIACGTAAGRNSCTGEKPPFRVAVSRTPGGNFRGIFPVASSLDGDVPMHPSRAVLSPIAFSWRKASRLGAPRVRPLGPDPAPASCARSKKRGKRASAWADPGNYCLGKGPPPHVS